jgi:type IV secretory pathway VirB3-like protein
MEGTSYAFGILMFIVAFTSHLFIAILGIMFLQLGLGGVLAYYVFVFVFWGWQNGLVVLVITGVLFAIMGIFFKKDQN